MARPIKEGLQYFPLDVDIDQDDKMSVIEAIHGLEGFGVVVRLMMKVYKEGYFYKWGKREQLIFSKRVNVDINTIELIVTDCLEEGFFNKDKFYDFGILTSKGIQKRYLDAITRRKEVYFEERYLLLDPCKYIGNNAKIKVYFLDENGNKPAIDSVNVDINHNLGGVNDNISTQSKVKESKVKESKVNNITEKQKPKEEKKNQKGNVNDALNPVSFYHENGFGAITPHVGQKVYAWIDDLSNDLVIHAMKIAIENNVLKWNYVEAILIDWHSKNIKTIEEVQAIDMQRKQQPNKRITKDENMPQYIKDQMSARKSNQKTEDEPLSDEAIKQLKELNEKLGITKDGEN